MTPALSVAEINAIHRQTVEGILKLGRTLIAAKSALPHGQFEAMIDRDLSFDTSTAQRLMKIARDPRLRKAAKSQLLPSAMRTLYELTQLTDAQFERAVASGATTGKEVRTIRVTESPMFYVPRSSSNVVQYLPTETVHPIRRPPVTEHEPPSTLQQIEELVRQLVTKVASGDVVADARFVAAAQRIAGQLLAVAGGVKKSTKAGGIK
jgi:Protein of unknown function (DUF3102)